MAAYATIYDELDELTGAALVALTETLQPGEFARRPDNPEWVYGNPPARASRSSRVHDPNFVTVTIAHQKKNQITLSLRGRGNDEPFAYFRTRAACDSFRVKIRDERERVTAERQAKERKEAERYK